MARTLTKIPSGTQDGSNTDFFTPIPFSPGSATLIIDGLHQDEGLTELNPFTGAVRIIPAPRPAENGIDKETVQIMFSSTEDDIIIEIGGEGGQELTAILDPMVTLRGSITPDLDFTATLEHEELMATLAEPVQLSGEIFTNQRIFAILSCGCE